VNAAVTGNNRGFFTAASSLQNKRILEKRSNKQTAKAGADDGATEHPGSDTSAEDDILSVAKEFALQLTTEPRDDDDYDELGATMASLSSRRR